MPVGRLKDFLDQNGVKYVVIKHSAGYTAQEVAAYTHIPGMELAKTVMIKIDGNMARAVLPASHTVDFERFREVTGVGKVMLATESEFKGFFPACDVGAMPPFGNLYGMNVYASEALTENVEIAFSAGSHCELIRLAYADYERLVQPTLASFSSPTKSFPRAPESLID